MEFDIQISKQDGEMTIKVRTKNPVYIVPVKIRMDEEFSREQIINELSRQAGESFARRLREALEKESF